MGIPRTILYPVDFSERCLQTWPAVAAMARRLRAPVKVIHAFDTGYPEADLSVVASEVAAIREQIGKKLAAFPGIQAGGVELGRELADGGAVESILRLAAEMDAPMIMMPTRGQTRFRALLLGSVTAGVLCDSPWPVWTDAHSEGHSSHSAQYTVVVCAIDMGPKTEDLLRTAKEFTAPCRAKLHVVHSVPGIDPMFWSPVAQRAHEFLVQDARERFPAYCQAAGLDARLEIVEDVALSDGIAGMLTRQEAELLIIGRGSIQGFLGRLRTNALELIRRSPCPVLSV